LFFAFSDILIFVRQQIEGVKAFVGCFYLCTVFSRRQSGIFSE